MSCWLDKEKTRKHKPPTPKINWDNLRQGETKKMFQEKVDEKIRETEVSEWPQLMKVIYNTGKEICGKKKRNPLSPWLDEHVSEVEDQQKKITNLTAAIHRAPAEDQEELREERRAERRRYKKCKKQWENEWWMQRVDEAKEAETHGDTRALYKTLRSLGVKDQGVIEEEFFSPEEYRGHFMKVSAERYERTIHELLTTAANTTKRTDDKTTEAAKQLEANISYVEFKREISQMKDSAPGIDGVTVSAIKSLAEDNKQELYHCMLRLLDTPPRTWPDETKEGWVVPLHKKGSRNDLNNYRGVCLLPLVSRVIARIFATRKRVWAETLDILGENQNGFRTGRSTCDATQIVLRIDEETRRVLGYCEEAKQNRPGAVLLDLTKTYPRVNRPLLWSVLANLGMTSKVLEVLKGLHEHTCYRIKGKEGLSSEWIPARGLREGCATSPTLFNIYHAESMRIAQSKRKEKAKEQQQECGLTWTWTPGNCLPAAEPSRILYSKESETINIQKPS